MSYACQWQQSCNGHETGPAMTIHATEAEAEAAAVRVAAGGRRAIVFELEGDE